MSYRRYTRVFGKALSSALIDLATVKEELGIAADDASKDDTLDREIKQISAAAASYCGRIFKAEGIVDTFRWGHHGYGRGSELLSLSRYPLAGFLLSPTTADTSSGAVLPIEDTSSAGDGVIVSGLNIPAGTTVSAPPDAAVDEATVTLTNTIAGAVPAGSIVAFGLEIVACPNTSGARVLVPERDYFVDQESGLIPRAHYGSICHWGAETIAVRYRGGYGEDDIPADLQMAVLRWITMRYDARGSDPSEKNIDVPGVMNITRWVDQTASSMPSEVGEILDRYRVPMVG